MPRLSDQQYIRRHIILRRAWTHHQHAYSFLSFTDQRSLHDYYQPAEDLTGDELLNYRAAITAKQPGRPSQAGRAFAHFRDLLENPQHAAVRNVTRIPAHNLRGGTLSVRSIARPTIDEDKLAMAFLMLAKILHEQKHPKPPRDL